MLHVPAAVDKNGTFVVPPEPTIDTWVLPSKGAGKGIKNCPTYLTSKGPAGGSVIVPDIKRS